MTELTVAIANCDPFEKSMYNAFRYKIYNTSGLRSSFALSKTIRETPIIRVHSFHLIIAHSKNRAKYTLAFSFRVIFYFECSTEL